MVAAKPAYDDAVAVGAVLRTDPAAGTALTVGAPVTLVLSGGPGPQVVPDVRGTPTKDAVKQLEKAGFTVTVGDPAFDRDIDAGDILRTDPGSRRQGRPEQRQDLPGPVQRRAGAGSDRLDGGAGGKKLDKLGFEAQRDRPVRRRRRAAIWDQSPGAGGRIEPGGTVSASAFP